MSRLAVVNFTVTKELVTIASCTKSNSEIILDFEDSEGSDYRTITTLDAHLNSMESYINPNINKSVRVGASLSAVEQSVPKMQEAKVGDDFVYNELGIALIEPVTATIEFNQVQREMHPTYRSVSIGMNAVSTMLSFEDLAYSKDCLFTERGHLL